MLIMADGKTLTFEIAQSWDRKSTLSQYTAAEDRAVEELAKMEDVSLDLGLTSISFASAQALSKQVNGDLALDGLTAIEGDVAEALSQYQGPISLAGLTQISDCAAESLSRCKYSVFLDGLTALTHLGLARKLAENTIDELSLPGLTEISAPIATALSKTTGRLYLDGLKTIPCFDLAWKFFQQDPDSCHLAVITTLTSSEAAELVTHKGELRLAITSLTEDAARALSKHQGELVLNNMASLSDEAAVQLSSYTGPLLELRCLRSLSMKAAEALSRKRKGYLTLSPELTKQVWLCKNSSFASLFHVKPGRGGAVSADQLNHGVPYDCKLATNDLVEDIRVIPLALDPLSNRRYFLIVSDRLSVEAPDFFRRIVAMSFYDIEFEDLSGGPDQEWACYVHRCELSKEGLFLENEDMSLFDFKESAGERHSSD